MMKRILAVLLCLVLIFTMTAHHRANADFGDFSGDSDYGGGGWSSGGDSDWGSSSSSGSSSGEGLDFLIDMIFWLIVLFFDNGIGGIIGFVIAVIVLVLLFRLFRRRGGKGHGGSGKRRSAPVAPGARPTQNLRPLGEYPTLDPAFDAVELTKRLSNWYVQMQNSWCDGDISSVRPFFSDAYYAQMERQLNQMKQAGRVAHTERIAVLDVILRGFYQSGGQDHMVAQLRTRIVDYTTDKDGNLISGSKTAEKFMTYEWILTRPIGTQTQKDAEMTVINCPNCGAALNINATAKCPYCDSIVTVNQHDWVISEIKGISQRTGGSR